MGISAPPVDPTGGMGGGGGMPPPGGAGGGQGVQILQQIQQLLAQLMQTESDPGVQKAVQAMSSLIDPLMQAVGQADQGNMTSGISNPTGPISGPDLGGGSESSEGEIGGAEPPSKSFGGAKKAAMANFASKGHFSKSGSKGETLQTDKAKNRAKGK